VGRSALEDIERALSSSMDKSEGTENKSLRIRGGSFLGLPILNRKRVRKEQEKRIARKINIIILNVIRKLLNNC